MRLVIAAVGRLKDGPERELYARYADRVAAAGKAAALGPLQLREIPEGRAVGAAARMVDEAERLVAKSEEAGYRIVLDECGKTLASQGFARTLAAVRDRGVAEAVFMIGGPDGHGAAAKSTASLLLSLGPMTLPHGLVRVVLAEQIYRAITILSGHPYHRN